MNFHALQTNPVWLDAPRNRRAIEALIDATPCARGDYFVLPEMAETGWSTARRDYASVTDSIEWLGALARERQVWIQSGFAEHATDGSVCNSAAVVAPDGLLRACYRKNFLFPSERAELHGGDSICIIDVGGARVCPFICYDLRFPELWRHAALAGAEVFCVSSSWPMVRREHLRALLVARAIENQCSIVSANRTGSDPNSAYAGASVVITPLGERVQELGDDTGCATLAFDRAAHDAWREKFSALRDTRRSLLGSIAVQRV